jgi:murein DD-endopeptidase
VALFTIPKRGGLDVLGVALCLWAAGYHTPAGALLRGFVAKLAGAPSTARPLLAYYTGGVYDAQEAVPAATPEVTPPQLAVLATTPPGVALARGVWATMRQRPDSAKLHSVEEVTEALEEGPSEEASVLALFAGREVAAFAARRSQAAGQPLTLESMAQWLPPSSRPALEATSTALTLGRAFALSWPVPSGTRITSPFGWRNHPTLGRSALHTGVDLAVAEGTVVKVVHDGIVRRASEDAVNGKLVIVDHGRGVATAYCHNSKLLVTVGQLVRAGDVVAQSGNTGRSTGPHLHYQLELARRPVDPLLFRGEAGGPPLPLPAPGGPLPGPSKALQQAFERGGVEPSVEGNAGTE